MMIQTVRRSSAAGSRRSAFTLLEVLVVMAILVIIAGAGAFGAFKAMDSAKRREAQIKMEKVASAVQIYQVTYGQFPDDIMALVNQSPDGTAPTLAGGPAAVTDPWNAPFAFQIMDDNQGSTRVLVTCQGNGTQMQWPEK